MSERIETVIKLLTEFDKKGLPIQLIDNNLSYLSQALMMVLMLEKEVEDDG